MSEIGIKSKGLSPGESLRLQKEMQRRTQAYGQLAVALQNGSVFGDNVSRLHAMIGGSLEQLQHAELELALQKLLQINNQLTQTAIRNIRA